jgi:hypothetical protein
LFASKTFRLLTKIFCVLILKHFQNVHFSLTKIVIPFITFTKSKQSNLLIGKRSGLPPQSDTIQKYFLVFVWNANKKLLFIL